MIYNDYYPTQNQLDGLPNGKTPRSLWGNVHYCQWLNG
jgi:hypothetical protein